MSYKKRLQTLIDLTSTLEKNTWMNKQLLELKKEIEEEIIKHNVSYE